MLSLQRLVGESIVVGQAGDILTAPIRITRTDLNTLGIDAHGLRVLRDELTDKPKGRLPVLPRKGRRFQPQQPKSSPDQTPGAA